jgi:hypothetical protein
MFRATIWFFALSIRRRLNQYPVLGMNLISQGVARNGCPFLEVSKKRLQHPNGNWAQTVASHQWSDTDSQRINLPFLPSLRVIVHPLLIRETNNTSSLQPYRYIDKNGRLENEMLSKAIYRQQPLHAILHSLMPAYQ